MFGVHRNWKRKRPAPRAAGRRARTALAALVMLPAVLAVPAAAADFTLGDEQLHVRMHPEVVRPEGIGARGVERLGLASMLRARVPTTTGPELDFKVGHHGLARPHEGTYELHQQLGFHGRLSNIITVPASQVAVDLAAGYRADGQTQFRTGTLETSLTLRAEPLDRLSTQTDLGWRGTRHRDDSVWRHGGHGRFAVGYAWPGLGRIGMFERLDLSQSHATAHSYETGLTLDFGPHTFSLSQRLDYVGRQLAAPPTATAAYGWQVGPLGMALNADYRAADETTPASGFAGFAISLGLAGPGPGALLDALR